MSWVLLAPLGLAALAALTIPLLIHLTRRDIQKPIAFAALRWLEPRPKPRRRPRLDELPLLAARLALLALLALVLARPAWRGESGAQAWMAVAPGADPAAARALAPKGAHLRWLAPGFPGLGGPVPVGAASISSLLRELDADLPPGATLTVAVPAVLKGVDAERPRLSRAVDWRVLPGATPTVAKPTAPAAPPALIIRYAPGFAAGAGYLRAAAQALATSPTASGTDDAPTSESLPQDARAIAWLAPGPLPAPLRDRLSRGAVLLLPAEASIDERGPAMILWRDAEGRPLAEGGGLGRGLWRRFTRPLESETMPELLAPDFPTRLEALLSHPPPPPALARARDLHPLVGARLGSPPVQDLTPLLALFVVALFALERWLATRAQRALTP
jgi:hypothetical protein